MLEQALNNRLRSSSFDVRVCRRRMSRGPEGTKVMRSFPPCRRARGTRSANSAADIDSSIRFYENYSGPFRSEDRRLQIPELRPGWPGIALISTPSLFSRRCNSEPDFQKVDRNIKRLVPFTKWLPSVGNVVGWSAYRDQWIDGSPVQLYGAAVRRQPEECNPLPARLADAYSPRLVETFAGRGAAAFGNRRRDWAIA